MALNPVLLHRSGGMRICAGFSRDPGGGASDWRSGRQTVTDPAVFRQQVIDALKIADQQARNQGYNSEDIKLAIFAVVAFVDESVLNLRLPVSRIGRAGRCRRALRPSYCREIFFKNLQELLGKNDSQDLADLLEVYLMCLLLGFAGAIAWETGANCGRLPTHRGKNPEDPRRHRDAFSGMELPPEAPQKSGADPLVKKIGIAAAACLALALILFVAYKLMLGSAYPV